MKSDRQKIDFLRKSQVEARQIRKYKTLIIGSAVFCFVFIFGSPLIRSWITGEPLVWMDKEKEFREYRERKAQEKLDYERYRAKIERS